MNKKDLLPILLLILLIPAWMFIDNRFIAPRFRTEAPAAQAQPAEEAPPAGTIDEAAFAAVEPAEKVMLPEAADLPVDEQIVTLENEKVKLELTSLGGGVRSAMLIAQDDSGTILYPELNETDSPPVALTFPGPAALVYDGIADLGANESLSVLESGDGRSVSFAKVLGNGTAFERTVTLGDSYLLSVSDKFINTGPEAWTLPAYRMQTGRMKNPADMKTMKGMSILGVDSFTPAGGINYWGRKLHKLYGKAKPLSIDTVPADMTGVEVDWVSAKNKFFTQILRPEEPVATMSILSSRDATAKGVVPTDVAAILNFKPLTVDAGTDYSINYSYYIGPKNYSILKESGSQMEKVMEFETIGFWSFLNWLMEPARRFLLWTLNQFYAIIPSYGIAIILLTLLVRILFWPLTHKSTEKMRENSEKMQVVQPKIKVLQEKYKNNPVKLREETMKVYQEHGFNPMGMMGGCLPMFVQLPVFIALFTVLRNAIELRYAGFLWIADLSAPENLLAGQVPVVGSLNILPIVMAVSMIWQQKLSSPATAATPEQQQQQKMMMFMMPIMMLFFFYSMPSGLVLYWTTSNLLMIGQTGFRNLRKKKAEA